LQNNLASIESGQYALAFSSGLGAVDALVKLLQPGDEVISTNDLYGGTYRLFKQLFERYGIRFHFVNARNVKEIENTINERTRMVWIESPSNPMLHISDIQAIAKLKETQPFTLVVDNTFATPYLQRPLELGADVVLHSATKYLGGHSDVVLGALILNDPNLAERLSFIQNAAAAVTGPMDCFLVLKGVKTLHVRMQRHCSNAEAVARYLDTHSKVEVVHYPGLAYHEGHELAKRQMKEFGGMVSFSLVGGREEDARTLLSNLKIFTLAESLGGVESLCGHPSSMTHASIPREERLKSGLTDSLIRLSVGIEDESDLIQDLQGALQKI
jgi:cystathionine beta-lyase